MSARLVSNAGGRKPAELRVAGLLSGCDHTFCLDCIRVWRARLDLPRETVRACPMCREESFLVVPSGAPCRAVPCVCVGVCRLYALCATIARIGNNCMLHRRAHNCGRRSSTCAH